MRFSTVAAVLLVGLGLPGLAEAKPGKIGLGLVGQDPSGITLALDLGSNTMLDFRLGINGFNADFLDLQGNFILSPFTITQGGGFSLPFYVGIGGEAFVFDFNNGNDGIVLQARVPVGVALDLTQIPLDFFLEAAPTLEIVPNVAVFVDAALGVRFWF